MTVEIWIKTIKWQLKFKFKSQKWWFRVRASDYKNHRIFTLRCLHNDLIPVSIKLKSTIKLTRAKQILRKAEKELLQARIKSINFILDNTSKQLEECRSKLVTIISTQKLRECQDFVDKVSENRFNKVKQRQINKLNLLTTRKEGNITRSNTNPNNYNHNHKRNHNSQVNSQVISQVPPGEDNRSSQAGPPHREASTSPAPLHASSQAREGGALPQAGTTPIPPGEDASLSQVSTPLSPLPSQPTALLPSPEDRGPPNPSNTQAGQTNNPTNNPRQGSRQPPRQRPPRPPRRFILPPG